MDKEAKAMGKLSKEEAARFGGARWMLDYIKEHGIEEAEKDLERRGIRRMPLGVNRTDLKKFEEYEKRNTMATVLLMSVMTLRDEFEFGTKRINTFINGFNRRTECIVDDFVHWKDYQKLIQEETGILIPLPEIFMEE